MFFLTVFYLILSIFLDLTQNGLKVLSTVYESVPLSSYLPVNQDKNVVIMISSLQENNFYITSALNSLSKSHNVESQP